jgi:thymidylate synthase ThyX
MITAKIIADSISEHGIRLTTFVVEFPRYILAEYNTHRVFSRNTSSTRAIPIFTMLEQIANSPAMPIYYGKNQSGMNAKEELAEPEKYKCEAIIKEMLDFCSGKVAELADLGLHKQHAGRYVEAWQTVKGVLTFTEGDNWYWLRDDEAAQPEIAKLAQVMHVAKDESIPKLIKSWQCHLPYVYSDINKWHDVAYYSDESKLQEFELTLEEAIKVSCARCAAVSYHKEDYNLEKCLQMYDRLVGSDMNHSSALEHVASPMKKTEYDYRGRALVNIPDSSESWQEGVSHADRDGQLWSGNLRGWVQHRKTVVGENYIG